MSAILDRASRVRLIGSVAIVGIIAAIGFQGYSAASLASFVAASALLAISLDLAWGYTGILSLGHGLFFGAAAYSTALALEAGVDSFALLALIAIGTGALFALVVGVLMFSGRSEIPLIYVAMATLALSFVGERVARSWSLIGSDTGMAGLLPPRLFGLDTLDPYVYLTICLVTLLVILVATIFMTASGWGQVLVGIRENELRMKFSGFRVSRVKVQVFTISGGIAGLGGFLYAFNLGVATPTALGVNQSTLAVIWVLAGGVGTLVGPVAGAVAISYLSEQLSAVSAGWWEIVLGAILIVILILFPKGMVGMGQLLWGAVFGRRKPEKVAGQVSTQRGDEP